jgi:3-isopropylmalate dehydratase
MTDAEAAQTLTVDLPAQTITRSNGQVISFQVESFRKYCLVNGVDDIGITLQKQEAISRFEQQRTAAYPWLDGLGYHGKIPVAAEPTRTVDW